MIVAAVTAVGVVLAALVTAFAHGNRRAVRRVSQALDVGNDRSLAEYVHGMAGTVEVTQAAVRTNTRDIGELKDITLEMRERVVQSRERLEATRLEVLEVAAALGTHVDETLPMVTWVRQKIREESDGA